jgi:hypothetical protein
VALRGRAAVVEDDGLHRRHHVLVEEAVHEARLQRLRRVGRQQPQRAGMVQVQVLEDDGRLDHRGVAVAQQRHAGDRPQRGELALHLGRAVQHAVLERRGVLVQGDQHLLRVRRERVRVQRQAHGGIQ